MKKREANSAENAAIGAAAAAWLARRDRGLSAAEQDHFLQWLSEDARHRAALAREEQTWMRLDALATWQPAHSARPNPDLLAPAPSRWRQRWRIGVLICGVAAAAAIALMTFVPRSVTPETAAISRGLRVIPRPERLTLPDGSIAELNHGGKFEVLFTEAERRVRLLAGELHVTAEKNPARPFIVEVDRVAVRAVGTAFNVRRERDAVEVLVTEGSVQIETPSASASGAEPVPVASGERARIETDSAEARASVNAVTPAEMNRELAWQAVRLEFDALPLAAVVAEFNLRNAQQLAIRDPAVAQVRVAGTFRADQVEAFVDLLEASFGLTAERRADGPWLLRRAE
jgi:transmembrane sensor